MQTKLILLLAFASATLIVCSGLGNGRGDNGFLVTAPAGIIPLIPPGSLLTSVKTNANCGAGTEDCIGEQEYGDATGEGAGVGSKQGESCASSILGLIATGDVGIKTAAENGGITRVRSIDTHNTQILSSIYQETCILVNGD
ncbi:MAG: TRL-like family protein [bacterium]|nr:TRL-like family protein [bacterium]